MDIHFGLDKRIHTEICENLCRILANEYFLYLKTLNFHWNITGHSFIGLHQLLEQQYEWLKNTIDEAAERIRTLGHTTPGNFKEYQNITNLANETEGKENQTADNMLYDLIITHEAVIQDLRNTLNTISALHDYATEDMLIQWLKNHEKITWMLRSHLQQKPEE